MYLVSACLAGLGCRYDGSHCASTVVQKMVKNGEALALCPELLAGFETPREACEIVTVDGCKKVISQSGRDNTEAFQEGAELTLAFCRCHGITKAILKSKSPSCGCGLVYNGSFSGKLIEGDGITAGLLKQNGIHVETEEEV